MASSRIDVRVDGKDNTSSAFNSVSKSISKLGQEAGKAGTTIGTAIGKGAQTATTTLGKLGTTASSTFQKIASGASSAGKSIASSFDSLSGALSGILAGYGAMNVAQAAWSGAVSQDFNKQFLATKVGTAAANEYVKTIQNIVAVVPGPDSWMNNLLSGAVAKQTNLTSSELKTLADMSASYYLTATGMGKSSIETQNDLNEYIKTGNTSQLERDSILKDQLGTLEGQETVSDRIKALQKAMIADGYDQVSQLNTLGNKWETFSGLIGKAATSLGNLVAPAIMKILDALMSLDGATGGWSTQLGLIGVAVAGIVSTLGLVAGPLSSMLSMWKSVGSAIVTATAKLYAYATAAKVADKADDGVGVGGTASTGGKLSKVATIAGSAGVAGIVAAVMAAMSWGEGLAHQATDVGSNPTARKNLTGMEADEGAQNMGESIKYMTANWNKMVDKMQARWSGFQSYIGGAWRNTQAWFGSGASQISAGVNSAWTRISSGAMNAFNGIRNAWNSLKSLVGQGAKGVVSVFGPTINSIRGAVSSLWNLVRGGASGVVRIFSSGLDYVRSAVGSLYSMVRAGASGVVSIVRSIIGGPGGPRGPGGPSGISYNYEDYGGWQKDSAWTGANSMSGNCADMTAGLISRYGGDYVYGTWNGNPHVWWKSPTGQEFDPARKALNGTGSPPPRGPNSANAGNAIIIQGDVYGFDDFKKKVEMANNRIINGVY